jgi:hypothetical protein
LSGLGTLTSASSQIAGSRLPAGPYAGVLHYRWASRPTGRIVARQCVGRIRPPVKGEGNEAQQTCRGRWGGGRVVRTQPWDRHAGRRRDEHLRGDHPRDHGRHNRVLLGHERQLWQRFELDHIGELGVELVLGLHHNAPERRRGSHLPEHGVVELERVLWDRELLVGNLGVHIVGRGVTSVPAPAALPA